MSRFKQEKGLRTIVINPQEFTTYFGIASDYQPLHQVSLISFKQHSTTDYNLSDTVLQQSTINYTSLNSLELQKISLQAQKDKPQRQDQMSQESVFELKAMDFPDYFPRFDDDFVFGDDCLNLHPLDNFYIHHLFTDSGHINFKIRNQYLPSIVEDLMAQYLEFCINQLFSKLKLESTPYPDDVGYNQVNAASSNIFGSTGKSFLNPENYKLFHRRRKLDYYQTQPFHPSQFIIAVVLPDNIDAQELRVWNQILFDRLQFEGVMLFTQSSLAGCYCGQSCLNLQLDSRRSQLQVIDPFYPLLNGMSVPIMMNMRILLCAFIQLVQQNPQLLTLGKILSACALADFSRICQAFGIPDMIVKQYSQQSHQIQDSIIGCLFFQLNNQLIKLFSSGVISLNVDDNKQSVIELKYPIFTEETGFVGKQISFSLGYSGLAVARCLFNIHVCNYHLFSRERTQLSQSLQMRVDPLLEQRDVSKTTKIQLDGNEIIHAQVGNKMVQPFVNIETFQRSLQQNQTFCVLNIQEIICSTLYAVAKNVIANESYLKNSGRKVESQIKIAGDDENLIYKEQKDDERTITTQKVKELAENIIISSCYTIGGLDNFLIQLLQSQLEGENKLLEVQHFSCFVDKLIDSSASKVLNKNWMLIAWCTLADGAVECAVSQEEYQSIGNRIWLEKAPFLYP